MSLIKYNDEVWDDPFSTLNTVFNQFFNDGLRRSVNSPARYYPPAGGFRVDVLSEDKAYTVIAELPGFTKDDVDIQLHNAVLTITGKRKQGEGEDAGSVEVSRSVTLGEDVDAGAVLARLENGLLQVTLPKSQASQPKAITIN